MSFEMHHVRDNAMSTFYSRGRAKMAHCSGAHWIKHDASFICLLVPSTQGCCTFCSLSLKMYGVSRYMNQMNASYTTTQKLRW